MRYFKAPKHVQEDGTVQYGNLPINFVIGYESDAEVVFPLNDQVELPEQAAIREIGLTEYTQFIDSLCEQAKQNRDLEYAQLLKTVQPPQPQNSFRKLLSFLTR